MSINAPGPETRVYQPAELNSEVRLHIEAGFPRLWLSGELSNLAKPASGHWYFTLKDARAQIRCALFRSQRRQVGGEPSNGDQVLVRGRLSLYEPRGDYQLIADAMLPAGSGALQQAFAALKLKLEQEGLFDAERKQALPTYPKRIALITSPSGAAIRDVLVTLRRRWPVAHVTLYPTAVQGDQAAAELVRALQAAERHGRSDVILLTRGGGSMEDLQAFNDETLARTIAATQTPIVCGVGHEHDVSIADWVADVRAATPTAAAEAATPDGDELKRRIGLLHRRLSRSLQQQMQRRWQQLDALERRQQGQHPQRRLADYQTRLQQLHDRLYRAQSVQFIRSQAALNQQRLRLELHHPAVQLEQAAQRHIQLQQRLKRAIQHAWGQSKQNLAERVRALQAVSPLSVLSRGYALIENEQGQVLTRADQFVAGQTIEARFSEFCVSARIVEVKHDQSLQLQSNRNSYTHSDQLPNVDE
ncbi:MAG: exodeoxyribonuclease VII large subunit [Pseudomonadota bacterium]